MRLDEARKLMAEIVAEKGEAYTYPGTAEAPVEAAGLPEGVTCQYAWYEGDVDLALGVPEDAVPTAPACIVGHFLHRAGVELEEMRDYEGSNAATAVERLMVGAGYDLTMALQAAQEVQDMGGTWGESLVAFNKRLARS